MKTKRFVIALHLSRIVAVLLVFCRHVVQAMTNNTWFPSPSPALGLVTETTFSGGVPIDVFFWSSTPATRGLDPPGGGAPLKE